MPSVRRSKRQTRLAFTPVPSSSPQAAKLPSSLRSRAATLSYDTESPSKKRKIGHLPGSGIASVALSQAPPPNMSLSPFTKRPGDAKRQTRLLPTPEASSQARNTQPGSPSDFEVHSGSDSDPSLPSLRNLTTNRTIPIRTSPKSANRVESKEQHNTDDEDSYVLPARSLRSAGPHHIVVSSDDDSGSDILPLSSPKRQTASASTPTSSSRKPAVVTPSKQDQPYSSPRRTRSSGLPRLSPLTTGSTRRSTRLEARGSIAEPSNNKSTTVPEGSSQTWPDSENESDVVTPTRSSRRGKHPRRQTLDLGESETSGDVERSPTKKTRRPHPLEKSTTPRKLNRQDEEDLEEDLEILQDTEVRRDRTRGRAAPTRRQAAQKQLDILRARRAGQKSSPPPSGRPSSSRVVRDTASESEVPEESEEDDPGADAIRQTLHDDNDEYDDDFVVDDADDALGAPLGLDDIPLEFTRHAHKKPKEHFKDAVEWMIQNKLNPAFSRNDPVYRVAFHKLEDAVKGYAGSKFVSSSWAGDFARALKARPEYRDVAIPFAPHDYHHCDACNRTNHPAKFRIVFGGKAYHPDTLETLSDDEEEDDGEEDERRSRDAHGNPIPPVDQEYFVGRFCKCNASIAHSLLHWRFHLNEWVLDWLTSEGHTAPDKILARESWSTKRRREYANGVVDAMEDAGEIAALWRDFKIKLDEARDYRGERFQ